MFFSYGTCFFVSPFWLPFCVCFYVLSKASKSPSLINMALCSRCPVAQSWEGSHCKTSLVPAHAPLGPPVKIQLAILRWLIVLLCLQLPQEATRETQAGATRA